MEWVEIKIEDILAHMPTDVKIRYDSWLCDHPEKAGRLFELTDNALREFRDNLNSVPENIVDPRETWVPQSAVRHLETIVLFTLTMEMGLPIDSAAIGARYSADIFLRQILMGRYKATTEEAAVPSPHFSIPPKSGPSRTLGILLALILFAQQAMGGWIRPDSGPLDTDVAVTFVPSSYSITTATLFSHLQGINVALSAVSLTNTIDATARATASAAIVQADAAYQAAMGAIPMRRSPGYEFLRLGNTNDTSGSITLGNSAATNFWNFTVYGTNTYEVTSNGFVALWTIANGTNKAIWRGTMNGPEVKATRIAFSGGDFLTGDGTNLFYVNAAKTLTNNLTGNMP